MESTMLLLYYTAAAGLDVFLSFCEMVLLHENRYSKIKLKKKLKGSLDLIPSPSVKIQIMGGKSLLEA
jgi:hypothetical protein